MKKFLNFIQEKIANPLAKMAEQRHLKAIRNGFMLIIPFIIAGSVFLIINYFPNNAWAAFIKPYSAKLSVPINVTFGLLAVIASLGIGYNLAKEYELDPIIGTILSFIAFLTTQVTKDYALDTSNFGSTGIFTAIVTAIISIEILRFFIKKDIVIKMPDGVPPAISAVFVSLIPSAAVITLFWVIRVVIGFDITSFLTMIFSPLVFALNTLPGIMVYVFFMTLLWTVGIHGWSVMGAIGMPIFLQYLSVNTAAFANHQAIPYITGYGFIEMFVNVGGTCATFGLVLNMIKSKSSVFKSLGKLSLMPAVFEINEPVVFGLPVVLNPLMMIPAILTPLFLTVGTYLLMYFNIISRPVVALTWSVPPIIGPYLVTGGDWRAAIWSAITIIIEFAVYFPFFKAAEKQQVLTETVNE